MPEDEREAVADPEGPGAKGDAPDQNPSSDREPGEIPVSPPAAEEAPDKITPPADTASLSGDTVPLPIEGGDAAVPAAGGDGYRVKLEVFEGPLDLLLFLIKKKKVEIQDIPLAMITAEYLEYLKAREQINLDREAEFILVAALLIHIKSQFLLPREQPALADLETKRELGEKLTDFQKVHAAAVSVLRDKEEEQASVWRRTALTAPLPEEDLDLIEFSLFDLAESFFTLMKRKQAAPARILETKEISLDDKMAEIISTLKEREVLDFIDYLERQETLEEALVAFFCLLELIKARLVYAIQEKLFHTIKVWLRKETDGEPEPAGGQGKRRGREKTPKPPETAAEKAAKAALEQAAADDKNATAEPEAVERPESERVELPRTEPEPGPVESAESEPEPEKGPVEET